MADNETEKRLESIEEALTVAREAFSKIPQTTRETDDDFDELEAHINGALYRVEALFSS